MVVCVNGSKREVSEGMMLRSMLEELRLRQGSIVIELNKSIVDKKAYSNVQLKAHDVLEIVHFVGGG